MLIERKNKEVIIRLPSYVDTEACNGLLITLAIRRLQQNRKPNKRMLTN